MERWQSWLIALASKASNGLYPFVGSNPTLSEVLLTKSGPRG
jgi:hypothetical protein